MKKIFCFGLVLISFGFAACDLDIFDNDNQNGTEIAIADLPTSITDYIAANFADYTIKEAENDTLCSGLTGIEVSLKRGKTKISVFFDSQSSFIQQAEEMKHSDIPVTVQAFVSLSFPDYDENDNAEKITLANGTIQYDIELEPETGNAADIEVIVNADGTEILCQE